MIRLIGLVTPAMKEGVKMLYVAEEPVILSGEKYEKEIGDVRRASYRVGLEETISWINESTLK